MVDPETQGSYDAFDQVHDGSTDSELETPQPVDTPVRSHAGAIRGRVVGQTPAEKTDKGLGRRTSRDKLKSLLQALCHSSGDLRRRQIRGGLRRFVDGSAIHRLRWLFQGPSLRKAARHTIQRPGLDPPSHPLAFVPSTIEADKIKP